jgi:hypothetical protein
MGLIIIILTAYTGLSLESSELYSRPILSYILNLDEFKEKEIYRIIEFKFNKEMIEIFQNYREKSKNIK